MRRISLYILVASLFLLHSCIKEDLSTCNSDLLLRFRYTLNKKYQNLFDAEVNKVTVFIFDSNGQYVGVFSEQGDKLTNDYVMHIPLPEGKYSALVYGGDFNTYMTGYIDKLTKEFKKDVTKGLTDINDFRIALQNIVDSDNFLHAVSVPDDLYSGLALNAISVNENKTITDVELMKLTKKVNVKIIGVNDIASSLEVYIISKNGMYDCNNEIDKIYGTFKYTPTNTSLVSDFETNFKIMRLMLGHTSMLVVRDKNTQEILYNEDMINQILLTNKYVSQEDFDREDEFNFTIVLDKNATISVLINGWEVVIVNPGI